MNIEDLIGETIVIKSLKSDNECATIFIIIGKLRSCHNGRFFVELYMKNHQYCFLGFHEDKIIDLEKNDYEQTVITIKD